MKLSEDIDNYAENFYSFWQNIFHSKSSLQVFT